MDLLKKLFILFLFTFPTGVIARIEFSNGVAVSFNDLVLAVLVVAWFIYKFNKNDFKNKFYLFTPIIIFVSIGFLALLLNFVNLGLVRFLVSFSYLVRFIGYAMLYFIIKEFSFDFKEKISKYLILTGAIVVIIGYFQYFFYPTLIPIYYLGWDKHTYRMVSVFLDPNFLGTFLNIYLIFLFEFIRKNFKALPKLRLYALSLLELFTFLAIYLTYSRSALIMLVVSVVTYLLLINKKKLIVLVVSILILLIFLSPRAFQTDGTNLLREASTSARLGSIQVAIKVVGESPFLGVGFNAYRYAQNKFGLNDRFWEVTHSGAGTDSSLLFVLATTGIVGLLSYFYLIFRIYKISKNQKNNSGIVLRTILIGILFNSLFINSLFYVFILEWIWILAGLTESSKSIENS